MLRKFIRGFIKGVAMAAAVGCLGVGVAASAANCTVNGKQIDCLKIKLTTGGLDDPRITRKVKLYAHALKRESSENCPFAGGKIALESGKFYSCSFYKDPEKLHGKTFNLILSIIMEYKNADVGTPPVVQCQYAFDFSKTSYSFHSLTPKLCTRIITTNWSGNYPFGELNIKLN